MDRNTFSLLQALQPCQSHSLSFNSVSFKVCIIFSFIRFVSLQFIFPAITLTLSSRLYHLSTHQFLHVRIQKKDMNFYLNVYQQTHKLIQTNTHTNTQTHTQTRTHKQTKGTPNSKHRTARILLYAEIF